MTVSGWDGAGALAPGRRRYQRILNERWPLRDRNGPHARGIPDRPNSIPVRARVVWEHDGVEWISGRATRWTHNSVYVVFSDPRWQTTGVWLAPEDVTRA